MFRVKYSSEKTRHTRPNIILLLFDPSFLVGVAGGFGGERLAWYDSKGLQVGYLKGFLFAYGLFYSQIHPLSSETSC